MARAKVDNKLNVVIGNRAQIDGDADIPDNSIIVVTDEELRADEIVYSVEKNVKEAIEDLEVNKVDKVAGKQLSTNDFTDDLKNKLEALETGSGTGAGGGYIDINYADLVILRDSSGLEKGAFYRIMDYETKTVQPETQSAGHLFDIIVQALDEQTVSENAFAINSVRDAGHFNGMRLEAWRLKYTLENDTDRFSWADTVNGKGVIYRMIDEYENDLPYDFKNIQFKRYKITSFSKNTTLEGKYYGLNNFEGMSLPETAVIDSQDFIWAYTFTTNVSYGTSYIETTTLNKYLGSNMSGGQPYCTKNIFGDACASLSGMPYGYRLGNNVMYDEVGFIDEVNPMEFELTNNNTIGNQFNHNTIGKGFNNNAIGNNVGGNTIGHSFNINIIGNNFHGNTIGDYFSYNTIKNNFDDNTIGRAFRFNTIGTNFGGNVIGNEFNNNTIENDVMFIRFSLDGTFESSIKYLHLKTGLSGTSPENLLDLYYDGLYGREYPTTFELISNGNVISSWEATPLTGAGKIKATKTTETWSDIPADMPGGGSTGGESSYININYADLVALRNSNNLQPGAFYRIMDYETKTIQFETQSAGHLFDIIVQALDEKTVSENASAIYSARDTAGYFNGMRLEAWKLKYTLENDMYKYGWANPVDGKGVIYRMIDEYENDLPYDFKNIQFKRYKITTYAENIEIEGQYYASKDLNGNVVPSNALIGEGDFIWAYTFTTLVLSDLSYIETTTLNKYPVVHGGIAAHRCAKNTFGDNNIISNFTDGHILCTLGNNVIYSGVSMIDETQPMHISFPQHNTIGNDFNSNTIGTKFVYNTIGEYFSANTIGAQFMSNDIGNNFYSNFIGNNFYENIIGNNFHENIIGDHSHNNNIGHSFYENTIGDNFYSNTIENDSAHNIVGTGFGYNTIGNYFDSNTIENDSYDNTIGNSFITNTIGNSFESNTIGNNFTGNTIGNQSNGNTIGNFFTSNTIGTQFMSNDIANNFDSNDIADGFISNTIGNHFGSNTIGMGFLNNTVGNNSNNSSIGNFFIYSTIENGVSYIQFSVDGIPGGDMTPGSVGDAIAHLHLKSGLAGTSSANKLDLYYAGLYGRGYPTTFEIIANGNVISSWEATPLTRTGKIKATKTTETWSDISGG